MELSAVDKKIMRAFITIFETGRYNNVSYGAIATIKGDSGGLSFGKNQCSINSGNLYLLLKKYIDSKGIYYKDISPYMDQFKNKDSSLAKNSSLLEILRKSGNDPVMVMVQDDFFDQQFLNPAISVGQAMGFTLPLSYAVIFDSFTHGSWKLIRDRTNKIARVAEEKTWTQTYLAQRKSWLANHSNPILHGTVYRVNTFLDLIKNKNWSLALPINCHGIKLTADLLNLPKNPETPMTVSSIPLDLMVKALETTTLFAKPDEKPVATSPEETIEVENVQTVLQKKGYYKYKIDNQFGPIMEKAVKAFQKDNGLDADGIVGNRTLEKLGLL